MRRLNGWHRLWIVLSAGWTISILVYQSATYPSPMLYSRQADKAPFESFADSAYVANRAELARFQSQPAQLTVARQEWWIIAGVTSGVPILLVGVLFLTVAWVRRGFTGPDPDDVSPTLDELVAPLWRKAIDDFKARSEAGDE